MRLIEDRFLRMLGVLVGYAYGQKPDVFNVRVALFIRAAEIVTETLNINLDIFSLVYANNLLSIRVDSIEFRF